MSCAKMAEPIDLPFGLWTRVGRRKHKFNCIWQLGCRKHKFNCVHQGVQYALMGGQIGATW